MPLLQKLFSELDPHRKTYLSLRDWQSAFDSFNENEALIVELKNYLQCQFTDVRSAFSYFQTFCGEDFINLDAFSRAVRSLIKNRQYKEDQLKHLYKQFLREPTDFSNGFNL